MQIRKVGIVKINLSANKARMVKDYVAEEKPLHLFLNKTHYATIYCSPSNQKELAVGHLLTEGIIKSAEEIKEITLKEERETCYVKLETSVNLENRLKLAKLHSRIITSACGSRPPYHHPIRRPKVKSGLTVKAETIFNCVNHLNSIAETFRKTGGVHIAAIYTSDGYLVASAEDVGRHNAVDKVIGIGASGRTDFSECFLALSGRLSGDIVTKAAMVNLPIVASLAAAIDSGIAVAKDTGLTLVGFVRGKRMNVYSLPERILS